MVTPGACGITVDLMDQDEQLEPHLHAERDGDWVVVTGPLNLNISLCLADARAFASELMTATILADPEGAIAMLTADLSTLGEKLKGARQ